MAKIYEAPVESLSFFQKIISWFEQLHKVFTNTSTAYWKQFRLALTRPEKVVSVIIISKLLIKINSLEKA